MRMCKKWMALGLAAMMALSLTACKGSGSQGSKASDESAAAKAEAERWRLPVGQIRAKNW